MENEAIDLREDNTLSITYKECAGGQFGNGDHGGRAVFYIKTRPDIELNIKSEYTFIYKADNLNVIEVSGLCSGVMVSDKFTSYSFEEIKAKILIWHEPRFFTINQEGDCEASKSQPDIVNELVKQFRNDETVSGSFFGFIDEVARLVNYAKQLEMKDRASILKEDAKEYADNNAKYEITIRREREKNLEERIISLTKKADYSEQLEAARKKNRSLHRKNKKILSKIGEMTLEIESLTAAHELKAKSARYKIIDGSESAHCCFGASIVDTKDIEEDLDGLNICECFEMKHAELIVGALNTLTSLEIDKLNEGEK